MNVRSWVFTVFVASMLFLLAGYGQHPVQASQDSGKQSKMDDVTDWENIARDVSNDISEMLVSADAANIENRHVQIMQLDDSSFSNALESFLVTRLTHYGIKADRKRGDDYMLYWSVQLIDEEDDTIIVNLNIQSGEDMVYRLSNIYSINEDDRKHYHFSSDIYHADKKVKTRTVGVKSLDDVLFMPAADTSEKIFFDFDRYALQDEHRAVLDDYLDFVKQNPGVSIVIEGHTDIIGSREYNQGLSERRAETVLEYFVSRNISQDRIKTSGHGFSRPLAPNFTEDREDNPEGRAMNRRAEIRVMPSRYVHN